MKTFLSIMIFFLLLNVAKAKIIHIPANQATIQAGIDAATTGDTVLVADGTYIGSGNKSITFSGKEIIVRSENGPQNCIIDCEDSNMAVAFVFNSSVNSNCIVEGFTIRNGEMGFWVYANSSPTISKNIIEHFFVGIYQETEGAPIIIGNIIRNNNNSGTGLSKYGGGISLEWSSATIMNNLIYENSSARGGGIYCYHSPLVKITNNTIMDNAAIIGGGLYLEKSPMTITNNIIAFSKYKPALNLNIYTYNFESHRNYEGAKITSIDYTFVLQNQGNSGLVNFLSTSSFGGRNIDSTFQMATGERKTIYINSKVNEFGDFGGLRLVITLNNDTLFVNADGPSSFRPGSYYLTLAMASDAVPASKEIVEIGHGSEITFCDVFGNGEGNYYMGASDLELQRIVLDGTNGNISSDPLFIDPEHEDYHLQQGSPCINAGHPDPSFNDPDGSRADMGALYYAPGTFVHSQKGSLLPDKYHLAQNYPNPFNPSTRIKYNLHKVSNVRLQIYSLSGQAIETLVDGFQTAGDHEITWQPKGLSSGIYFYRLQAGEYSETKKLILQK